MLNPSEYADVIEQAMTYIMAKIKTSYYPNRKTTVTAEIIADASERFGVPLETLERIGQFNLKDK